MTTRRVLLYASRVGLRLSAPAALALWLVAAIIPYASAQREGGAGACWTASIAYGARAHLTARESGGRSDLVTLGHTYGPTARASVAYHASAGWVFAASVDVGRSNRSSDEVTDHFAAVLAAYPGDFLPDWGSSAYAFQPKIANRYSLGFGRELPVGRWTLTPQLTAGVLDVPLAGIGRMYKQQDANRLYDIRLRPSTRRVVTPAFGAGASLGGDLWRGFGLRVAGELYYARPRYGYDLLVRERVAGSEEVRSAPQASPWLVGQLTAGLTYRLPLDRDDPEDIYD